MPKYVGQRDWVDSIMGVVENLEYDGRLDLFNRLEADVFYREKTRAELEEKISELESLLDDKDDEITDLRYEVAQLEDDGK